MQIRRRLLAIAAPVALGLVCAGPALAASKVTWRVEGAQRTLLAPRTVTTPSSGSITKAGAPAGSCPADSAAGAFNVATHGRWNGSYSSGLGVYVTNILGVNALFAKGSYWDFFVNDRLASEGICATKVTAGDQFLFAQVPAKGRAELPIVVKVPSRLTDGHRVAMRTYVYTGKGNAIKPVTGVKLELVHRVDETGRISLSKTNARGVTTILPQGTGQLPLVAVAKGEIRSAPFTLNISR